MSRLRTIFLISKLCESIRTGSIRQVWRQNFKNEDATGQEIATHFQCAANGHGHSHSSCTKAENTDARTVATGEHRHTHQHEHRDSASSHEHSASSNNNNYEAQLKILRQVTQRLLDSHHKQE